MKGSHEIKAFFPSIGLLSGSVARISYSTGIGLSLSFLAYRKQQTSETTDPATTGSSAPRNVATTYSGIRNERPATRHRPATPLMDFQLFPTIATIRNGMIMMYGDS